MIKRYDCYYENDFGDEYPAHVREIEDGEHVLFTDHESAIAAKDAEIARLRQGLWDVFREAGGDTDGDTTPAALVSDIVPLVLDCVKDLRSECDEAPPVEGWISVKDRLPKCSKKPNSFGVQVLVYPPFQSEGSSDMPVAFYGCRQTDEPNFYMFGRVFDPEYWMPLPPPPNNQEVKPNPESAKG